MCFYLLIFWHKIEAFEYGYFILEFSLTFLHNQTHSASCVTSSFGFYKMGWEFNAWRQSVCRTPLDFYNPHLLQPWENLPTPNAPAIFNDSALRSLSKTFDFILEINLFIVIFNQFITYKYRKACKCRHTCLYNI